MTGSRRLLLALLLAAPVLRAAERPGRTGLEGPADARALGARIEGLLRRGSLSLSRVQDDPDFYRSTSARS